MGAGIQPPLSFAFSFLAPNFGSVASDSTVMQMTLRSVLYINPIIDLGV